MQVDEYLVAHNMSNPFDILGDFETKLAAFFNAKYAVLTDCCTHAIELCLRVKPSNLTIPAHTYLSVPMTAIKLGLEFEFVELQWRDYYKLSDSVYDAAVLWQRDSYIPGSMMCVSFQHKKHINIGRGGCILLDNQEEYNLLKRMRHDGRDPVIEHTNENVTTIGYHYYMTPESALRGIEIFEAKKDLPNRIWTQNDYADLRNLEVFAPYV